jgi:hypothetical protein
MATNKANKLGGIDMTTNKANKLGTLIWQRIKQIK